MPRLVSLALLALALGPAATAQTLGWLPASDGLPAGPVQALAEVPSPGGAPAVVAGTLSGVYRLPAGDPTWTYADAPALTVGRITRADTGRLYAVADSAVLVSDDGGRSWLERPTPGYVSGFYGLAAVGPEGRVVFAFVQGDAACRRSGLVWHRSDDGGRSWACQNGVPIVDEAEDIVSTASGALLAVTSRGIFRSTDAGATWSAATDVDGAALGFTYSTFGGTAGSAAQASYIALVDDDLTLRISADDGRTWRTTPIHGRAGGLALGGDGALYAGTGYVSRYRYGDTAATVYPGGVYRSSDGGRTWVRTALASRDGAAALARYAGGILAATTSGPVWSGDGGITSVPLGDGFRAQWTLDLAAGADGTVYAATWPRRLARSRGPGTAWEPVPLPPFDPVLLDYGSSGRFGTAQIDRVRVGPDGTLFVVDGNLLRLRPAAATWEARPVGFILSDLVAEPSGTLLAGAVFQGVFRSRDSGDSWARVGEALPYPSRVAAVLPLADGSVVAGGFFGAYRLEPGGTSWAMADIGSAEVLGLAQDAQGRLYAGYREWTEVGPPGPLRPSHVLGDDTDRTGAPMSLAVVPPLVGDLVQIGPDGATLGRLGQGETLQMGGTASDAAARPAYTTTGRGGILRSLDGGRSWNRVGPAAGPVDAVTVDRDGRVFAGPLVSVDGGETWAQVGVGLRGQRVTALVVSPVGTVWAGTYGGGVYRTAPRPVGSEDVAGGALGTSTLSVSPNPSRGLAEVTLALARPSPDVEIAVYDVLGRQVASRRTGPVGTGESRVPLSMGALTPGVYLVRAVVSSPDDAATVLVQRVTVVR